MHKRKLGQTDLNLTTIGLGTWAIGGSGWDYGWGEQSEKDSIQTIREALECGINWIDTAAVYGVGRSEAVVGKALREWGKEVILATKCGLLGDDQGKVTPCIKKESIFQEVDNSLKRLQVDCIDLYQIHWPSPPEDIEEAFVAMQHLVQAGKIRYAGVSNFSVKQLESIRELGPIASLQPPYHMLERRIETEQLPWCAKNQVGVISYSPMACGLLTSKFSREWVDSLPTDDWRKSKNANFQEPKLSSNLKLIKNLTTFAAEREHTLAQLSIAWVLRRPEVTAAIVGARKPGQIQETAKAADWQLNEREIQAVEVILETYIEELKSFETSPK